MKLDALVEALTGLDYAPLTSEHGGRILYEFVRQSGVADVLELGFAHGTSSAYIAAALDELGAGRLTTIDRESARARKPNIDELLALTGLRGYVQPIFAQNSYNWELMTMIEEQTRGGKTEPRFDFCFIDGAHTWTDDGLAFFLVDKLLVSGRWILFDDLHWRFADSPATKGDLSLPEAERVTPQVMKVFSLLVYQHPGYEAHRVREGWGWARKADGNPDAGLPKLIDRLHGSQ